MSTKKRAILKSLTYRIICTTETFLVTFAVAWCIVSPSRIAAITTGILLFIKILTYYAHERVWEKINWGKHNIKQDKEN